MQADQLSALGGLVGSGVAFVALAVSIWAVIVAKRNAGSAEQQAEVAAKTYRLTAKPDMTMRIQAARQLDTEFAAVLSFERSGGPPELRFRYAYTAFLHLDVAVPELREEQELSDWFNLDEGNTGAGRVKFVIDPPHATAEMLNLVIEVEMIEPDGVGRAIPWRKQEWLEWVSPDIIPHRNSEQ